MVSNLARCDFERMQAEGLSPTLDDFDRLNQYALRLTDGAETTCANFPRVGWAGDVPFHEPTLQAFSWYHGYASRVDATDEAKNTFWFFALAHARTPHFFDSLQTPEAIENAVREWAEKMPVTLEEVQRACRHATGERIDGPAENGNPKRRADKTAAAENLERIEAQLRAACGRLHVAPDALMCETQSRISEICEAAAVDLGRPMKKDEADLRAAYDAAFREIYLRLKAEKSKNGPNEHGDDDESGENIRGDVPFVSGAHPAHGVSDGAPGEKPEEIIVVAHAENNNTSGGEGQAQ